MAQITTKGQTHHFGIVLSLDAILAGFFVLSFLLATKKTNSARFQDGSHFCARNVNSPAQVIEINSYCVKEAQGK